MIKKEKGITLIALIVTIIVLLILAGISIAILTGQDSTLTQAKKGKEATEISSEKEAIRLATVATVGRDSEGLLTEEDEEILKSQLDKYIGKNLYELEYDSSSQSYKVTYVNSERSYYIDADGNIDDYRVIFSNEPSDWTNQNVTVTISETTKYYKIQYKTEADTGKIGETSTWTDYPYNGLVVERNEKIYVRLVDEITEQVVDTADNNDKLIGEVTNIDKLSPNDLEISVIKTTNSIEINANTEDAETTEEYGSSGIYGYAFSIDDGKTWTDIQESGTYKFENLKQTTEYKVKVKAVDIVGNETISSKTIETETVPDAVGNITFNATPIDWTNQNVTVNANVKSSNSQFSLETKANTAEWSSEAKRVFDKNGTMYARLVDSTGQTGKDASYNVTNIDKLAPKTFTPQTSVTTNSVKVTANTDDTNENEEYGKSGISGYRFSKDGGKSFSGWQSSGTYTFDKLTQTSNYSIVIEVKDVAGNTTKVTATATTATVPGVTLKADKTEWTNGNVIVTATANKSGFTLQTKANNNGWGTASSITFSANGTMYARLVDSTGQTGSQASYSVTNIDKVQPTVSISGSASSIIATQATISYSASDTGGSKLKSKTVYYAKSGGSYTSTTATTLNGLSPSTKYNAYIIAYDNAGNSSQSSTISFTTGPAIAEYNSTEYTSIQNAFNAVSSSGTVKLLVNRTEDANIDTNKTITFNLNGKTLQGKLRNTGKLVINSSGTIKQDGSECIKNYGTVELSNLTIKADSLKAIVCEKGTVTINSGAKIEGAQNVDKNVATLSVSGASSKIVINGGTITGKHYGAKLSSGATLQMTNGSLKGEIDGIVSEGSGNKITISGGTVTGGTYTSGSRGYGAISTYEGSVTISITGGKLNGGRYCLSGFKYASGTCTYVSSALGSHEKGTIYKEPGTKMKYTKK